MTGPQGSPAALTFGILALVFGPIVIIADIIDLVSQGMAGMGMGAGGPAAFGAIFATIQTEQQAMAPFLVARDIVMALMSVALIIFGIGLVGRREWGRRGAVIWSFVAFAVLVARVVLWEVAVQPHMDRMMTAMADSLRSVGLPSLTGFAGGLAGSGRVGEYVSVLVLLTFPVVMVILMTRPGVRARMRTS
jgi:hypothetical protein